MLRENAKRQIITRLLLNIVGYFMVKMRGICLYSPVIGKVFEIDVTHTDVW